MPIEKEPFRNYTLEEDKLNPLEKGKLFTIRLNAIEYRQLKEDMKNFNIRNESTMLKLLANVGRNVTHNVFGVKIIRWLFRAERVKLEQD